MAVFGRRLGRGQTGDMKSRMNSVEEYIEYMTETLEYKIRHLEQELEQAKGGSNHGE